MAGNVSFPGPEAGQPTPFLFDTGDPVHDDLAVSLFRASEVGAWAEQRQQRYPELIKPRIMYVAPWGEDDLHHVAWVDHRGTRQLVGGGDYYTQYAVHHVACDCLGSTNEGQESVEAVMSCKAVKSVLGVRAQEIESEFRNSQLLAELSAFDQEEMELVSSQSTEAIQELAITTMLTRDHLHPETWMANIRSGILVVSALARVVCAEREELVPLLDAMQEKGMVEHDTYQARLGLAAFDIDEGD